MAESPSFLSPEQCAVARRSRRVPQARLAAAIKKSQVFISLFERGKAKLNARDEKIICRILGLGK